MMTVRLTIFLSMAVLGGALLAEAIIRQPDTWIPKLVFMLQIIFFSNRAAAEVLNLNPTGEKQCGLS